MTEAKRTVIVCDWLPPEFGAVGQYMVQRALAIATEGGVVTLIGLGNETSIEERDVGTGRLIVHRLKAVRLDKSAGLLRRALWALHINGALVSRTAKCRSGRTCEIHVTGSPPFLSYVLIVINGLFWRSTLVYRITDFYPEVVFAAGHLRALSFVEPVFRRLRQAASRIEALGQDQRRRLIETGIEDERITVVRDASPIADWASGARATRPYSEDDVILLYSGNLGVAHDIKTFCEGYRRHIQRGSNRVRLWVNGTGARLADLKRFCIVNDLPAHFTPPASLENLPGVLKAADAHLVLLGDAFWGFVLPSKIYACIALDQPVFYVGPRESDVHMLCQARKVAPYFQIDCGDAGACEGALESLADRVLSDRHDRQKAQA